MAFNEDSSASGHDEPWIQWFCGLKGHEMFCEVERSYIEDGFNLYGLRACVSNFSDCLDLILDRIGPDDSDDSHLTQSACTLYGLIHARYIITAHGLDAMYNKYAAKDFGTCPLVQCQLQNVLPVGLKDEMGADTVKLYCPKCQSVYHAPPVRSRANSNGGVDGAAFGTTFPHLFLMTFSNLVPDPLPVDTGYVPRVFGFRVHKSVRSTLRQSQQQQQQPTNSRNSVQNPRRANNNTNTNNNNNNSNTTNDASTAKGNNETNSNTNGNDTANNNNNSNNTTKNANNAPLNGGNNANNKSSSSKDTAAVNGSSNNNTTNAPPANGNTASTSNTNNTTTNAANNNNNESVDRRKAVKGGREAPTFLMENPSKRRRRGGGST